MNPRESALAILSRIRREEAFAAPLLDAADAGDDRDRRFLRNLVLGVLRWRSQLDFLIATVAGRKISSFDPLTLDILRLGFYQLLYTDVPSHAAVSETVRLAQRRIPRAKAAVNAILRKASIEALRDLIPADSSLSSVAIRTAHPPWLLARWRDRFGEERSEAIAVANQELSSPDLLVNTQKISIERVVELIRERGGDATPSPLHDGAVRLRGSTSIVEPEIRAGLLYAMDEGSISVALSVSSDSRTVLDLAAAPGGKSLVLALRGHEVTSHDLSVRRLLPIRESFESLIGRAPRAVAGDGKMPAFRRRFDSVLLDAPCSATGTIRRNPELKWRLVEGHIEELARLQVELLSNALSLAGNECVYSTCSLEAEENEAVVAEALKSHPGFVLAAAPTHLTPEGGTDGFTIHRLVRR